jgi:thiosulfate reductase cytochrome b subunit
MTTPTHTLHTGFAAPDASPHRRALWVRLLHWLIAFAVLIMVFSGWAIYNASPIFADWRFPKSVTLGGWLGGAIQWHFAAMWIVAFCSVLYLTLNVVTGRLFHQFLPLSPRVFVRDVGAALRGKLTHDVSGSYNTIQKVAYLGVFVALIVVALSGLAIWKPVQFGMLSDVMGGFDTARMVHFFAMAYLAAFFVVHLVMVALVPRSLLAMLTIPRKQK